MCRLLRHTSQADRSTHAVTARLLALAVRVLPPPSLADATRAQHTCLVTTTCSWWAHGWSQLHTHGLSNPSHLQLACVHARVAGWCCTCLCLQRQRSTHAPCATM